jgi:hypothetical protein
LGSACRTRFAELAHDGFVPDTATPELAYAAPPARIEPSTKAAEIAAATDLRFLTICSSLFTAQTGIPEILPQEAVSKNPEFGHEIAGRVAWRS